MSTTTPARPAGSASMIAAQIAKQVIDRLKAIEAILNEQLRLSQSSVQNFIGAGTVAGGGTIGTVPLAILAGNPKRRGLSIQNLGAAGNLSVGVGTTQPQPGTGITLLPGQAWDGRISGAVWKGSVSLVGSAAGVVYSWLDA